MTMIFSFIAVLALLDVIVITSQVTRITDAQERIAASLEKLANIDASTPKED